MLEDNVLAIKENISQAAHLANRATKEITLIAVTKSVTSEQAAPLLAFDVTHFAENRLEHLLAKQADISDQDVTWHFVGRLQRRKVKDIINRIDYFHALDTISLAAEIQKRAEDVVKCFVQVNVSEEASKQGVSLAETINFIDKLQEFDKIKVVGLMTMAPYDASEELIEKCFISLRHKRDEIMALKLTHAPCTELSMGMSQDYQLAIQAGATFVRIGTAFFKN